MYVNYSSMNKYNFFKGKVHMHLMGLKPTTSPSTLLFQENEVQF